MATAGSTSESNLRLTIVNTLKLEMRVLNSANSASISAVHLPSTTEIISTTTELLALRLGARAYSVWDPQDLWSERRHAILQCSWIASFSVSCISLFKTTRLHSLSLSLSLCLCSFGVYVRRKAGGKWGREEREGLEEKKNPPFFLSLFLYLPKSYSIFLSF